MSYRGKTLILKDESYARSVYLSQFIDEGLPPPPPATNVYSSEEDSGIKKVYVTAEGKAYAIV